MQAGSDLFEKRARIYSDRPRNVFDVEMVEKNMVLVHVGDPVM
jgi:hypothetical protein